MSKSWPFCVYCGEYCDEWFWDGVLRAWIVGHHGQTELITEQEAVARPRNQTFNERFRGNLDQWEALYGEKL